MPKCCNGCCYVDCIPDCCDEGQCGPVFIREIRSVPPRGPSSGAAFLGWFLADVVFAQRCSMPSFCFCCVCCRRIWDCLLCGSCSKKNDDTVNWNKPGTCCCGCCKDTHCCNRRCLAFRKNWCMLKCCDNNCIMDPCALCWGPSRPTIRQRNICGPSTRPEGAHFAAA